MFQYRKHKFSEFGFYNQATRYVVRANQNMTPGAYFLFFIPDIRQSTDYSPFGVTLQGRNFMAGGADGLRYGFQGQEMDNEVKGEGNSVNYKYRMHDPRVGRFFAVDPLVKDYPYYTPYQFSGNEVIRKLELEGLEPADYLLKESNVGKTFIAVSQANGQTGKKYYWTLKSTSNSIYWDQGNRVQPPKPKPSAPVTPSQQSQSDTKWASAVKLENTLNSYANESWNSGNYLDALSWKFKAMSSGFEGETGLYRKGIPTMAATASTIVTFGSGSLFTGAVTGGIANGGGNLVGQWSQTGSIYKVDGWSVGLSAFGGAIKNPWVSTAFTSSTDAAFDIKFDGSIKAVGYNKSLTTFSSDLGFGLVGGTQSNFLQKSGISQKILNRRAIIIGGMQQYSNGAVNDKLDKK